MTFKRLLWVLGFDYDELWPSSDAERARTRADRRIERLRRQIEVLVCLRRAITALEKRIRSNERRAERLARSLQQARIHLLNPATLELEIKRIRDRILDQCAVLKHRQMNYGLRLGWVRRLQMIPRSSKNVDRSRAACST